MEHAHRTFKIKQENIKKEFEAKEIFLEKKYSQMRKQEALIKPIRKETENIINIIGYEVVNSIKITFPRKNISGSLDDTDIYGCQMHVPLANIEIGE